MGGKFIDICRDDRDNSCSTKKKEESHNRKKDTGPPDRLLSTKGPLKQTWKSHTVNHIIIGPAAR